MTAITTLDQVTEYPLCWPPDKPRAAARVRSPFKTSMATAQVEIVNEMRLWRAVRWTISMAPAYRTGPTDPGVALWFELDQGTALRELRVLACDQYPGWTDNLHAIGLTLEALRAVDRWGAYSLEQAMEGAKLALPSPDAPPHWSLVIQCDRAWPLPAIEGMYRSAMKGADPERMRALNAAIEAARAEKGA